MYSNFSAIRSAGFSGFITVAQLWEDHTAVPDEQGIYMILNADPTKKEFLKTGVGGFFKNSNPNVSIEKLEAKWVENTHVLYIGKAGGDNNSSSLKKRLKLYLDFGKGKPVGHKGGRFIWQLAHHPTLIVAWKKLQQVNPRSEEKKIIAEFELYYGRLPFANLKR